MSDKCETFVARWDHAMCSTCGAAHAPTPTVAPGLDLDAVERETIGVTCADMLAAHRHAPALIAEVRSLRRHYDAAGPDHNLLALLDLYHEREQAALAKLVEAKRLGLEAVGFNLSDPTEHTAQCASLWPFRGRDKKCDCPAAIAAALEAL